MDPTAAASAPLDHELPASSGLPVRASQIVGHRHGPMHDVHLDGRRQPQDLGRIALQELLDHDVGEPRR